MPTPARKTPAKKTTAAVRGRREVRGENNAPTSYSIKVRGETFEVSRDRFGSSRVFMRIKLLERYNDLENSVKLLFDILGQKDSGRFVDIASESGADLYQLSSEFFAALNKASNVPNS